MPIRLTIFTLVCLQMLTVVSGVWANPLVSDPGDQVDPDVHGNYVVYRDLRYRGAIGAAVIAYDLTTGSRTTVNPSWNADNRPAVGDSRVLWCERQSD